MHNLLFKACSSKLFNSYSIARYMHTNKPCRKGNLTIFDDIKSYLVEKKEPIFRYSQIVNSVFKDKKLAFDQMNTLPLYLRKQLEDDFGSVFRLKVIKSNQADQANKVLFGLNDGERVEAVAMDFQGVERNWQSLCISSQVGCSLKCSFCSTGAIGYKRNMSADEIIGQVLYFNNYMDNINSISFMGMGEPLLNPNIFSAIGALTNKDLFNFSQRRISVSTVGIIPALYKLITKFPQINIAFSLHSPFEEERQNLMPISKSYSIDNVMDVLDQHIMANRRKVFLAYVMLKDINDSEEHLLKLINLINSRKKTSKYYHVNLLPYHSTLLKESELYHFKSSSRMTINNFLNQLKNAGINVTVRQSFGEEIDAACGQLYGQYSAKNEKSTSYKDPDNSTTNKLQK